jgi:hypothetical protein
VSGEQVGEVGEERLFLLFSVHARFPL